MQSRLIYFSLFAIGLAACKRDTEIKVYRVSKAPLEEPTPGQPGAMPANAPSPSMPGGMGASAATRDAPASKIKWAKPETWTDVPPSAMRYASFSAGANDSKVDISIVTFPGEGGSDTDNVNRWRQQLGLPPMTPAAVATQVEPLKSDETAFSIVDIAGANARTLAAWTRRDGHVWFFKATGPSDQVGKEKPNFIKFIQSVRF
jgi:hypothetical protein